MLCKISARIKKRWANTGNLLRFVSSSPKSRKYSIGPIIGCHVKRAEHLRGCDGFRVHSHFPVKKQYSIFQAFLPKEKSVIWNRLHDKSKVLSTASKISTNGIANITTDLKSCCAGTSFAAQVQVLLRRYKFCCAGTSFAAQVQVLLRRYKFCCAGTSFAAQVQTDIFESCTNLQNVNLSRLPWTCALCKAVSLR